MCGRFAQYTPAKVYHELLGLDTSRPCGEIIPRWNIAPGACCWTVTNGESEPQFYSYTWGYAPAWATKMVNKPINARSETVDTLPVFRAGFRTGRVLIPANGWYEWKKLAAGKRPYYHRLAGAAPFFFGGIADSQTFAILTAPANECAAEIHDRMPVIIRPADYRAWLAPGAKLGDLREMMQPLAAEAIEVYPVSIAVNKAGSEGSNLIEREEKPS